MQIIIKHTRNFRELAKLNETVQTWHHNNYPNEFKPFNINEVESDFEKMLQNENVFAFIASHQNKSIGYLLGYLKINPNSAFQYEKRVLYIDQVVVIQSYQKHGAGQLLLEKAYQLAKIKLVKEIQLDFWTGNDQAERFFSRNGFNYFNHRMKK